jgi:CheY-like chemotaxis protein
MPSKLTRQARVGSTPSLGTPCSEPPPTRTNRPPVLYVEDDPGDTALMRHAWNRAEVENPLVAVPDGEEGQRYLSGEGRYANRTDHPMPCLILLDLKLPKMMSGLDVLIWIREQPDLRSLPIVILSSSSEQHDIETAHALGANAYRTKPQGFDEWVRIAGYLKATWLTAD